MDAEPSLGCAFNISAPFRTAALMSVAGMSEVEKVPLLKFYMFFAFFVKKKPNSFQTPKKKNKVEASPPPSMMLRANVLALSRLALVAWTSSRFH